MYSSFDILYFIELKGIHSNISSKIIVKSVNNCNLYQITVAIIQSLSSDNFDHNKKSLHWHTNFVSAAQKYAFGKHPF